MSTLLITFIALSVFGLTISLADFLGILGSQNEHSDGDHTLDMSHDNSSIATHGSHSHTDLIHNDSLTDHTDLSNIDANPLGRGSYVANPDLHVKSVAKVIGMLRSFVYFSLGAGPTGVFAVLTGMGTIESLLWAFASGVGISILARAILKFVRRDLDSNIDPDEFIMDDALVIVTINPGEIGKVRVRTYGVEKDLYAKAIDEKSSFKKGEKVKIVDRNAEYYLIQNQD